MGSIGSNPSQQGIKTDSCSNMSEQECITG